MGRSVVRCNLVDLFIVNGLSCPKRKVRANMSVRGLVTVVSNDRHVTQLISVKPYSLATG